MTKLKWQLWGGAVICAASLTAHAGALSVSPVVISFAKPGTVQSLRVGNNDDSESLIVQVEVFEWSQTDGQQELKPSRDFLATPAILEIAPSQRSVVRVGARHYPDERCENSYRLLVTEIPKNQQSKPPIKFRTRISLPLFARKAQDCAPVVTWSRDGYQLTASNRGDAHIKYLSLTAIQDGRDWAIPLKQVGYVLPGAEISYQLPAEIDSAKAITIELQASDGSERVTLQPRS